MISAYCPVNYCKAHLFDVEAKIGDIPERDRYLFTENVYFYPDDSGNINCKKCFSAWGRSLIWKEKNH